MMNYSRRLLTLPLNAKHGCTLLVIPIALQTQVLYLALLVNISILHSVTGSKFVNTY